jgi:hypothetical protein
MVNMRQLKTTLYRYDEVTDDESEFGILVDYDYTKACPGSREYGTGLALEPDSPEEIEVTQVTDLAGNIIEITEKEIDALEDKCLKEVRIEQASFAEGY